MTKLVPAASVLTCDARMAYITLRRFLEWATAIVCARNDQRR